MQLLEWGWEWNHGLESSYRDLAGEQVQLISDTGIVPLALYLNSIYQYLVFYTRQTSTGND